MRSPVIYYVRHGETDWNAAGRFQGWTEVPLNDRGRAQADAAGQTLASLFDHHRRDAAVLPYVSSPLGRARETMERLRAALDLPREGYATDPRLREVHYGRWEGLTLAQMRADDARTFAARERDKWNVAAPAGETYQIASLRVKDWLSSLRGDTVVVAHAGTARALMVALGVGRPSEVVDVPIAQGVVHLFTDGRHTVHG